MPHSGDLNHKKKLTVIRNQRNETNIDKDSSDYLGLKKQTYISLVYVRVDNRRNLILQLSLWLL